MPKRFTDSEKWRDKWFRKLSSDHKLAYLYLLDACDLAGVVELDDELAEFQMGCSTDWELLIECSGGRLARLSDDKIVITKFIEYQYGELKEACNAHKAVIRLIEKHGLETKGSSTHQIPINDPSRRVQDKDKDKDKDKDSKKERGVSKSVADAQSVFDEWNRNATEPIKPARKLTPSRRDKLLSRLKDPDWPWREAIAALPIPNDKSFTWQPDFDWLIANDSNALKIVEGKYDRRSGAAAVISKGRDAAMEFANA